MSSGEVLLVRRSPRVRETFGSRFAFIVAAIGMAVGTVNIWRFPRVAGEWGHSGPRIIARREGQDRSRL